MLYKLIRPLAFALPPERAHDLVMALVRAGERLASRSERTERDTGGSLLRQDLWGLRFPNPVGLAAGFDKNARGAHFWAQLGFGFAELGTITALAQPGNPPPRIFRLPADRALINRLGFNNDGAEAIAARLQRGGWRRPFIPIGINIGKSRATSLADAAADYARSFELLFPVADYVAVNVSSPNTPGLRDLQAEKELGALLERLGQANASLARQHGVPERPLLVKIAPDLSDASIAATVQVARRAGASGIIATNTTIARPSLQTPIEETGGLSGVPLRQRATGVVRIAYGAAEGAFPIIGVGGIFGADDAYEKIRAGASLVQIYTGLIYEGPFLARRIARGLEALLKRDGFSNVSEAVGVEERTED